MWNQLKQRKLNGLDFDRQKIIGNYIVDFFCAERAFVLEIDGDSHEGREDYDFQRDAYMGSLGLIVLRIRCEDVLERMDRVVELLREHPALASLDEDLG